MRLMEVMGLWSYGAMKLGSEKAINNSPCNLCNLVTSVTINLKLWSYGVMKL